MKPDLNWEKSGGLIPAVVQDAKTGAVLMLGFMNQEAFAVTMATHQVTFFSRSRQRLWTKGENSGRFLDVVSVAADCDRDTLLIQVLPRGPVCHLGTTTCFGDDSRSNFSAISQLEQTIEQRRKAGADNSYTAKLFIEGRDRITQKVGEEAVEVLIASKNPDDRQFVGECTDLIFHLTVLLVERGLSWDSIYSELNKRSK